METPMDAGPHDDAAADRDGASGHPRADAADGAVVADDSTRPQRVIVWQAYAAVADSVPHIRGWTRRQLRRRGVSAEQIGDMELMVSEAATNAVRHADSPDIVVMLDTNGHVEAAVRDEDPARPRPRQAGPLDGDGRGMTLIQGLADAWGVRVAPIGKWVWFRINRSRS